MDVMIVTNFRKSYEEKKSTNTVVANFYAKRSADRMYNINIIACFARPSQRPPPVSCIHIVHSAILKLHAANHPSRRPISTMFLPRSNVNRQGTVKKRYWTREKSGACWTSPASFNFSASWNLAYRRYRMLLHFHNCPLIIASSKTVSPFASRFHALLYRYLPRIERFVSCY